jgi:hypothetical protein
MYLYFSTIYFSNSLSGIKNHLFTFGLVFLFNIFLLNGSAIAQDTVTGAFQGDVSNNLTGDRIAGAVVEIKNEQTGVTYNLLTDSKGRFYQGLLAPGTYLIKITITGYKPRLLRRPLNISKTGEVVPVPVSLEPEAAGATQPSAAIVEEADNIRIEVNTTDARRDGSFKEADAAALPIGSTTPTRTFDELALLLPGIAPAPQTVGDVAGPGVGSGIGSAGQFTVNGLRSRGNNFTVDGSDNNDEDIGVRRQGFVALTSQPVESVQEFQIITLLAPAQFGRNLGAQVNIVSKSGGNNFNGSVYGFFNANRLNARNYFDTTNGSEIFALRSRSGQSVLLDGQPLLVRNQSGGEDSFAFGEFGGTLGGAIVPNKLFYFVSGEYQKINASVEKGFAVPTVEQRGPFGTGASGIFNNFLTGEPISASPQTRQSAALFSLFPFPNNPTGIYGDNTFTQVLQASGRGVVLSGRLDNNFKFYGRQQTVTGRYNFTDDERIIPVVNEAIFSSVQSNTRTHNFSFFLNSQLSKPDSNRQVFNQIRLSFGRTRLNFDEVRDTDHLIQSGYSNIPFLLNAPLKLNLTTPAAAGVPNTGAVQFVSSIPGFNFINTTEQILGPIGEVIIRGFSPLGTDVYNFPQTRVNNTYQIADEFSMRSKSHTFVFGADIRRTDLDSDLPRLSRPLLIFNGSPRIIIRDEAEGCPAGTTRVFPYNYNFSPNAFCLPGATTPDPIVRAEDLAGLNAASNFLLTFNVDRPDAKANLRYYQLNFYGQDTWRVKNNLSLSYGLRYEFNTPVREVNGIIEQALADPRIFRSGLTNFVNGRKTLYDADRNNFAPRIGIAYSPNLFGKNRTSVFRAGYGIFYDQILGAVVNQSRNVYPTYATIDNGGAIRTDVVTQNGTQAFGYNSPIQYTNQPFTVNSDGFCVPCAPIGGNCFPLIFPFRSYWVVPGTINVIEPRCRNDIGLAGQTTLPEQKLETPMAHHYSVIFEQQLNKNLTVSVGYVGTTGRKLLRFTTPNLGASNTVAVSEILVGGGDFISAGGVPFEPVRPTNSRATINQFETSASSRYDSIQAEIRGRLSDSLSFQAAYTFSKVTDDVSDVFDLAGAYVLPQNSLDLEAERGPANFDVRHRWTYQAIYNVPKLSGNSFLRVLTANLQIAGIGKFRTGQPFTVNSTIDVNLDGNLTDRLNSTNGIEITGDRSQPLRLTTDNYLSLLAPFGQDGKIKRNSFRAGSVLEFDLSVIKQFSINGRKLSFRTDIFNFINRANFGVPARLLEAPGFGKATNTVTPGRRIQFALKYEF